MREGGEGGEVLSVDCDSIVEDAQQAEEVGEGGHRERGEGNGVVGEGRIFHVKLKTPRSSHPGLGGKTYVRVLLVYVEVFSSIDVVFGLLDHHQSARFALALPLVVHDAEGCCISRNTLRE